MDPVQTDRGFARKRRTALSSIWLRRELPALVCLVAGIAAQDRPRRKGTRLYWSLRTSERPLTDARFPRRTFVCSDSFHPEKAAASAGDARSVVDPVGVSGFCVLPHLLQTSLLYLRTRF